MITDAATVRSRRWRRRPPDVMGQYSSTATSRTASGVSPSIRSAADTVASGLVSTPSTTARRRGPGRPSAPVVVGPLAHPNLASIPTTRRPRRSTSPYPVDRGGPRLWNPTQQVSPTAASAAGPEVVVGRGGRLLQQQVRAAGERLPGQLGVGVDRGADDRDVRADLVQEVVQPGGHHDVPEPRGVLGARRHGVAHPGQPDPAAAGEGLDGGQVGPAVPVQPGEDDGRTESVTARRGHRFPFPEGGRPRSAAGAAPDGTASTRRWKALPGTSRRLVDGAGGEAWRRPWGGGGRTRQRTRQRLAKPT